MSMADAKKRLRQLQAVARSPSAIWSIVISNDVPMDLRHGGDTRGNPVGHHV
jgi:hypothetical protein